MVKRTTVILFTSVSTALVIFLLIGFSTIGNNAAKTGYVNTAIIYNDFPLKKELEAKLLNSQNARKAYMDSLSLNFNLIKNRYNKAKDAAILDAIKNEYLNKQDELEAASDAQASEYNSQIWKQINQYVKEYGEVNNYEYIYGADGTGTNVCQ